MKKIYTGIAVIIIIEVITIGALLSRVYGHTSETTNPAANNAVEDETVYTIEDKDKLIADAEARFKIGDYANTVEIYKKIIELDPTDSNMYAKLAHTYRYWYKYDESEKWFLKALEVKPNDSYLYTDLGKLYRNMKEYEKAEAAFLKSIELDPTSYLNYGYGLGYLYLEQGRHAEAEPMFLKALELAPDQEVVYMELGDFYREVQKYDQSEAMFRKALEMNPQSESYYGLGLLYEAQGRYEEAANMYLTYFEKIREKGEIYNALARTYMLDGKIEEAKKAVARAIELTPDNPLFYETQKWIDVLQSR